MKKLLSFDDARDLILTNDSAPNRIFMQKSFPDGSSANAYYHMLMEGLQWGNHVVHAELLEKSVIPEFVEPKRGRPPKKSPTH